MAIRAFVLDCSPLEKPDCATIERIARLQLAAGRCGCELRLRNPNAPLLELIGLVGLEGVLRLEPRWQPEEREQPCRVEEERELDDPSA
jgi:anti-anti-sigma regulatory factor